MKSSNPIASTDKDVVEVIEEKIDPKDSSEARNDGDNTQSGPSNPAVKSSKTNKKPSNPIAEVIDVKEEKIDPKESGEARKNGDNTQSGPSNPANKK